jgi:hypothetical protein
MAPLSDTSPEAEAERFERLRKMSPRRKVELIQASIVASRRLIRTGIALRHPEASEQEREALFRRAVLGDDLAEIAYGAPNRR